MDRSAILRALAALGQDLADRGLTADIYAVLEEDPRPAR